MPTYEYLCKTCGLGFEAVQSFKDDSFTVCSEAPITCPRNGGGELRKVFGNVGITFKGSGFYKNDSRPTGSSGGSATSTDSSSSGSSDSSSSSSSSSSSGDSSSSSGSGGSSGSSAGSSGSGGDSGGSHSHGSHSHGPSTHTH
jgi:putative FmdB family regulatory protein